MTALAAVRPPLAAILGLDHVVLRVADLDAAEAQWRNLGFTLTPRGFHTGRGSANHTTPFENGTYIELIHLADDGVEHPFGARPVGPVAVALRPTSSAALHAALVARGYDVPPPRDLARPVTLGAETRAARFLNQSLPSIGLSDLRLFACQHLTSDLVWRPDWTAHDNGAAGVVGVVAVARAPHRFRDAYGAAFGDGLVELWPDGLVLRLGAQTLSILTPAAFAARFPGQPLSGDLDAGVVAAVTLRAAKPAFADALVRAGLPATSEHGNALIVGAEATGGTLLEIVS